MHIPNLADRVTLLGFCLLIAMFLHEAWVNLVDRKISRFSLDALLVYIFQRVGSRTMKKNVKAFPRNRAEIGFVGVCALLAGLKGIFEIIAWIDKYRP